MDLRQYAQQTGEPQGKQQQPKNEIKVSQREVVKLRNDNERLKTQQANLNQYSGTTKAEILRGLDAGKSLTELFCIACRGISGMTSETLFYKSVCGKLKEHGIEPEGAI